jgi:hypothetical protein
MVVEGGEPRLNGDVAAPCGFKTLAECTMPALLADSAGIGGKIVVA